MTTKTIQNYMTFVKLFHRIPDEYVPRVNWSVRGANLLSDELLRAGIVLVDGNGEVVRDFLDVDFGNALKAEFGVTQAIWDQTFHKSWEKVQNAPIEQLVFEQLVHYFSTYGMEALGMNAVPMLPVERVLTDPGMRPNIRAFTIIRFTNKNEANTIFEDYLAKTKAPHKNMVDGIIELMRYFGTSNIDNIASFELKVACCDMNGIVPNNPQDFLRYLVYKATGSTMLVKNKATIESIKAACARDSFGRMFVHADLNSLASIFYRFKPIFLAFRADPDSRPYINTIRRLAPANHKPMSEVNVQNLTKLMKEGKINAVNAVIRKCSGRQLIKLLNYCSAEGERIEDNGLAVYNIRNGKLFVNPTTRTTAEKHYEQRNLAALARLIAQALIEKYAYKLDGKKFYLPDYVSYAVPVSEKQFIGNIPYGSRVSLPAGEPITVGIAWENFKGHRTDIDLHMTSPLRSFGWNSGYRANDMVYSGDMTDATNGAAEVFRFTPTAENKDEVFLLSVSNYTARPHVPFKFLVTEEEAKIGSYHRNTPPIKVEDAMFPPIPVKFDENNSMTLGLVYGSTFYFYGGELGTSIIPKRDMYKDFLKAMTGRIQNMVQIKTLIGNAGGTIVTLDELNAMSDEEKSEVIDLSPGSLDARTLLDIVDCGD